MPRCGPNTTPHFDVDCLRARSLSLSPPTFKSRPRPQQHPLLRLRLRLRTDLQPNPTNCRLVGNQQKQHGDPVWFPQSRFVYFLHPSSTENSDPARH